MTKICDCIKVIALKRIWNNMPLSKKLMLVTVVLFLALCAVIFVAQIAFFENYYTYTIASKIKKAVGRVEQIYNENVPEEFDKKIIEIADGSDCYIMLIGDDGAMKYMLSYSMTVKTETGERYKFTLDHAANNTNFINMELEEGDTVGVEYVHIGKEHDGKMLMPYRIESGGSQWTIQHRGFGRGARDEFFENILSINGIIEDIALPYEQTRNLNAERASAAKAAMEFISNKPESNRKTTYYFTDDDTNERFVVHTKKSSKDNIIIFAIAPLGMVEDAGIITRNMFLFWFFIAMGAACLLGVIFSRVLTKPIIEFSAVTKRMASMDFSRKCKSSSNDEIGELAKNINILSDALDSNIAELKKANERLTADIEKERLMEKSRRDFVAAASHELKTPISIIRAYTEALIDGVSENKKQRYTEVIIGETEKMDNLISEMLESSRYDSGAEKLNLTDCDICELFCDVIKRFDESMKKKNLDVVVNMPKSGAVRRVDSEKIERVIINYVSNALKNVTENGKIICCIEENNDALTLSIENSGAHIPEDEIHRVWEKFYKADKARNRKSGGTGLGLSIVKNILEAHNAEYFVENTEIGVKFGFVIQ